MSIRPSPKFLARLAMASLGMLTATSALADPSLWTPGWSCKVEDQHEISQPPPQRQEGARDLWCSGFAAVALVQQNYCRKQPPGNCHLGNSTQPPGKSGSTEEQFSVIDVLQAGRHGALAEMGDLHQNLLGVRAQGALARESCASYDQLETQSPEGPAVAATWYQNLTASKELINRLMMGQSNPWPVETTESDVLACAKARGLKDQFSFDEPLADIAAVLRDPSLDPQHAAAKIALAPACIQARVPLPAFQVQTFASESADALSAKITEQIGQDRAVGTPFCNRSETDGRCIEAHDTVIIGERVVRCGDKVQHQYLLNDSVHAVWTGSSGRQSVSDGEWVDRDSHLARVLSYQSHRNEGKGDPASFALQWLE